MRLLSISIHVTLTPLVFWAMLARDAGAQIPAELVAPPTTRTVNVDGLVIRARTAGLDNRKPAQPAVVFESGAAAPLETWDSVLQTVARFARCDRSVGSKTLLAVCPDLATRDRRAPRLLISRKPQTCDGLRPTRTNRALRACSLHSPGSPV